MKSTIQVHLAQAIAQLQQQNVLPEAVPAIVHVERTIEGKNGDYASNMALMLAKVAKMKPRDLAELIVAQLPKDSNITKVEIAGPGFINFFLAATVAQQCIAEVLAQKTQYGHSTAHAGTKLHIEYVSANPTGPLHVGHGRSAAYGASLANMLAAVGYQVHREYYVNDAGRQMHILTTSVWLRYLKLLGATFDFPRNGYQGEYVIDIAKVVHQQKAEQLNREVNAVFQNVVQDAQADGSGDKEKHIDGLIANAKQLLGDEYQPIFSLALETILSDIQQDLSEFGGNYQDWFSEQQLVDNGAIDHAIEVLQEKDYLYKHEGALWFKSTDFGDDKDRVIQRANGARTYFANDIAYHLTKLERGFDEVIDVLGADHHGYVPRVKAAMQAFSGRADALSAPLIQFVSLFRGTERVAMSTRSGEFITLRQLRQEVGNDAARFFYVMRKGDQAMDFDLELAISKSNENPVYYIQYAHARVASVLRQLIDKGISWSVGEGLEHLSLLTEEAERQLLKTINHYPNLLETAAINYEPHQLVHYLRQLANEFHSYYNSQQFIVEDAALRQARLNLICAVQQVIANGLGLLGVSAPEEM